MDNSGPTLRHAARPVVFVTLAVVVLLAARDVAAQPGASADPRQAMPERPTVATHAHAVAPGILELETGFQFQHSSSSSSSWTGPVLFKIGLANHVQLGISPGWLRTTADGHTTSGFGDAVVALKWQLTVDAPVVGDFAIEPSLKLPTGSERLSTGTGTTDFGLLAISSHEFGPVSLDVNTGYTYRTGDGTSAPKTSTFWTCSAGFQISERLTWVAEIFGYPGTTGAVGSRPIVALLTGPTFEIDRSAIVDAGVIFNIEGFGGRAIYAGITWNVGRLWTPAKRPR